jgi:hypothetical protein
MDATPVFPGANGKRGRAILRGIPRVMLDAAVGPVILFAFLLAVAQVFARPGPQWAGEPESIRQWFQSLMQPDNPSMSCCGEADAYEADNFEEDASGNYVAIITDGKGVIPNGTHITIPDAKIKWDKGNPTGHGFVFIGSQGQIYCYVTPGGA